MPYLILHEHESQKGSCLPSMVKYAKSIPLKFDTIEQAASHIRTLPYERDPGLLESAVPVPDYQNSGCVPWQRQRIWPKAMNCWEATAHWLAHALALLHEDEIIEIWDRDVKPGIRHVWPTIARKDGIWLVTLESTSRRSEPKPKQPTDLANVGWEDVFGAIHTAGAGVLGFFLGADRAAPIVREAEKAWGSNIADWSKQAQPAAKAGEAIAKYSKYAKQPVRNEATKEGPPKQSAKESTQLDRSDANKRMSFRDI